MLHYLDPHPEGSPAVLLLHGLGSEGASWILQLGALTEAGYRPVAPDTAGFGASAYDGRGWSIRRSAQELKGLVHALGCGAVHVVGLSMGGVIAQQFALDYPEQVRKVALANTFAVLRPRRFSGWVYFLARMLVAHLVGIERQAGLVAMRVFPEVGQESLRRQLVDSIYRADPRAYRAAMRALGRFNSVERLKSLRKPVLVISGENDTTVPLQEQQVLVDAIPGARHVIIPRAGHAVSVEGVELFNKTLLTFLSEIG